MPDTIIDQEIEATGVAPVIVILKSTPTAAAATGAAANLSQYFTTSEMSQESAIERAARGAGSFGKHRPSAVGLEAGAASPRDVAAAQPGGRAQFRERPTVRNAAVPEAVDHAVVRFYPNLGVALGTVNRQGLAALRQDGQVEDVVGAPRIGLIRPTKTSAAALRASMTWGIRKMRAHRLWEQGLTGEGVLVGHLDTGVDGSHPALRDAVARFAEFDYLGSEILPTPDAHDTDDHGTHTAATIAGRPQRSRHLGVAPGATLASAIVIEGGQVVARVLGGMDWAVGQGVRILSMSLGLPGWWDQFLPLTQILRQRGVLPVFAVGNEGPGTSRSPGNYAEAMSVGAIDRYGDIAWYSSSQRFMRQDEPVVPDLVAPGSNVISAKPGGGYVSKNGTSMATPHVAGLAALLMQAKPNAPISEIEDAIRGSARLAPLWPVERAGHGLPDAVVALDNLMGSAPGAA